MPNQGALVDLLAAEGVAATQATVSRDLDELGAIKVRMPGGETAYAIPALPKEQLAPEDHLRRVFGDWVVEVAHSDNLVVVRTPPGSAHVVGLGPRPLRHARRARHRRRRRHDHRGRRHRPRRRGHGPAPERARRPLSRRPRSRSPAADRPPTRTDEGTKTHGEASGAGLQRRPRHLRGRPLDDRELRRRGHHRRLQPRSGGRLGGPAGQGLRRRRGRGHRRRLPRGVRPGLPGPGAARPTPSTRASTRWCRPSPVP